MIAFAPGAGLERPEVGADIGFGEHRGRQYCAAGDLRQPFGLLRIGAAHRDQPARDLRPRAERDRAAPAPGRKSAAEGTKESVSVELGGRRCLEKKKTMRNTS